MSGHGYRYTGKGERFRGVPARDLTQAQYDAMSPLDQRTVDTSGAYEAVTTPEVKKAEEAARKAQEQEAKRTAAEANSQNGGE